MRCWCGYLSGTKCKLFASGPADATASQNLTVSYLIGIQTGFTFLVLAYPGCPGKRLLNRCSSSSYNSNNIIANVLYILIYRLCSVLKDLFRLLV